jgi:DNA-binding IclR family transcriptional regulator
MRSSKRLFVFAVLLAFAAGSPAFAGPARKLARHLGIPKAQAKQMLRQGTVPTFVSNTAAYDPTPHQPGQSYTTAPVR